jgi:RNA polymerase sigma-70 factor (ECF subfamily)
VEPQIEPTVPAASLDPSSAAWLRDLEGGGHVREDAVRRLRELMLRACRAELARRAGRSAGPDVDDLAHQAASDATLAVLAKLDRFRGESRFTTWAYAFAVFEVSAALGRRWRRIHGSVELPDEAWQTLPDRLGAGPDEQAQARELTALIRRSVDEQLTPRQRAVFVAVVVNGVPLDAVVDEFGTNRNAVYKTVFDARRKIRSFLDANGYPTDGGGR